MSFMDEARSTLFGREYVQVSKEVFAELKKLPKGKPTPMFSIFGTPVFLDDTLPPNAYEIVYPIKPITEEKL